MKRKEFGELENAVLALFLREKGPLTVRAIHKKIGEDRAYTTLLTVTTRLYQKGVLKRQKEGRSFVYLLKKSKENTVLQKIKKHLHTASPVQVFNYFLSDQNGISSDEIDEIEQMIEEYKRKQR